MTPRLSDLAEAATEQLRAAGIDAAPREARQLLAHAAGQSAARIAADLGEVAGPDVIRRFRDAVARRCAREPMSHIKGKRLFYKHEFSVTPDVLDPRPETEALVLAALGRPWGSVLDLGTGSGAILLSLLAERPEARGTGTDLSQAALDVARGNAGRLGLAARCAWQVSDWFGSPLGRFDLIVSNPPYIALDEMQGLAPELSHEPRMALTDGADGLSAYRAIIAGAGAHLEPGGWLMMEIGWTQGAQVAALMAQAGLRDVAVLPDMGGHDRVVTGRALA